MEVCLRRRSTLVLLGLSLMAALLILVQTYCRPSQPTVNAGIQSYKAVQCPPIRDGRPNIQTAKEQTKSFNSSTVIKQSVDSEAEQQSQCVEAYVYSSMPLGPALQMKLNSNQSAIVAAIEHAWKGYKQYAWGADELLPLSKKGHNAPFGMAMTLIDSLDTLWLAGLQQEFDEGREWVREHFTLEHNTRTVSLFETNIRVLGGLLSAYHLSLDKMFLEKATELGRHLLPAFDTPSGIPSPYVHLQRGIQLRPGERVRPLSVAEAGTLQLEFKDLTRATGDQSFQSAVDRDMDVLLQNGKGQLMPMMVNPSSGRLQSGSYSVGAGIDSYYEYLLKQWIQSSKTDDKFQTVYLSSVEAVSSHLLAYTGPSHLPYLGRISTPNSPVANSMDHLSCFYPGTLALGLMNDLHPNQRALAEGMTHTCYRAYKDMPNGLAPDIFALNRIQKERGDFLIRGAYSADFSNILRPETVESLFYLYRLTGDNKYRDWGWEIFKAFERHTKVDSGGYTCLLSVLNPEKKKDKMESFFISETLKYLLLLFTDDPNVCNLSEWVLNTEAHPLPVWTH